MSEAKVAGGIEPDQPARGAVEKEDIRPVRADCIGASSTGSGFGGEQLVESRSKFKLATTLDANRRGTFRLG